VNAEIVPGVSRPPRRSDYIPLVKGMRPFVSDEELVLRALTAPDARSGDGDQATACEYAWPLLDVIERTASRERDEPPGRCRYAARDPPHLPQRRLRRLELRWNVPPAAPLSTKGRRCE
jgi:hypothetical protein